MVGRYLLTVATVLTCGSTFAASLDPAAAVAMIEQERQARGLPAVDVVPPSRPLPPCTGTIAVDPSASGGTTAQLSCDRPAWTRALRLRDVMPSVRTESATAKQTASPPMAVGLARSMAKGEVIGANDLVMVALSERAPDQIFASTEDVIGRKLRRSIGAGSVVFARHLEPNWLVQPEVPVLILSETGGISVTFKGVATEAGALGDSVLVENASSGRTIAARVIGKDMVRVVLKPFKTVP